MARESLHNEDNNTTSRIHSKVFSTAGGDKGGDWSLSVLRPDRGSLGEVKSAGVLHGACTGGKSHNSVQTGKSAAVFQKHFQPPGFQALQRPQRGAVVYPTGMCQGDIPREYHISGTEKMTAPPTHDVRAKLHGA